MQMVDTTCPWVAKVWNSVDTHTRKQYTSVIHGKYSHEETIATASFASNYIIVKDLKEAQYVCDYILQGGNREEFLQKFSKAVSAGFDPETMLDRVGLANQTTMLKGETEQIGKMLEKTMLTKYGPAKLNDHFLLMETICDATQERQDALYEMVADPEIDMMIVVGGFNSSNTSHLQEIAEHKGLASFWVDSAARIDVEKNVILHKLAHGELKETTGWLNPGKPVTIGITSGASTPDRAVEEVLHKVGGWVATGGLGVGLGVGTQLGGKRSCKELGLRRPERGEGLTERRRGAGNKTGSTGGGSGEVCDTRVR